MIRESLVAALVLVGALALAVWVAGRVHRAHVRERAVLAERAARAALEAAGVSLPITTKVQAEIAALHALVRDLRRRLIERDGAPLSRDNGASHSRDPPTHDSGASAEAVVGEQVELPRPARTPFFPPADDSVDEPTRVLERP